MNHEEAAHLGLRTPRRRARQRNRSIRHMPHLRETPFDFPSYTDKNLQLTADARRPLHNDSSVDRREHVHVNVSALPPRPAGRCSMWVCNIRRFRIIKKWIVR